MNIYMYMCIYMIDNICENIETFDGALGSQIIFISFLYVLNFL